MGRAAEVTEAREVRVGESKREGQRGQRCVVRRPQSGDGRELSGSGSPPCWVRRSLLRGARMVNALGESNGDRVVAHPAVGQPKRQWWPRSSGYG